MEGKIYNQKENVRLHKTDEFMSFMMIGGALLGGVLGLKLGIDHTVHPLFSIPTGPILGIFSGAVSGSAIIITKEYAAEKIKTRINNLRENLTNPMLMKKDRDINNKHKNTLTSKM